MQGTHKTTPDNIEPYFIQNQNVATDLASTVTKGKM